MILLSISFYFLTYTIDTQSKYSDCLKKSMPSFQLKYLFKRTGENIGRVAVRILIVQGE